MTYMS